ncbi:cat eye syndrome critical region protein 2 homolog, partial [Trichonephila clavata]
SNDFGSYLLNAVEEIWILEERNENIPLSEEKSFENHDISTKVDLLYSLCMYRLNQKDAVDVLRNMDADSLRVTPLGCDALGNEYWYFYGTRLYKQEPSKDIKVKDWKEEWNEQKNRAFCKRGPGRPKKTADVKRNSSNRYMGSNRCMNIDEKSRWSVVCHTFDDWIDFAAKFQDSTLECEKALFQTLKNDFLPVLNEIYEEKGRRLQEKLLKLIANSETTQMQTRKQKSSNAVNGHVSDSAHREYLAQNRANRLKKRNGHLNENEKMHCELTSVVEKSDELQIDAVLVEIMILEISDLENNIMKVLTEVRRSERSKPFLYPIDKKEFPNYDKIIDDPICISDIFKKLAEGCYQRVSDIDDDFQKMVSNSIKSNGKNSKLHKAAENVKRIFNQGIAKLIVPQNETPRNDIPETENVQKPFVPHSCKRNFEQTTEHGRKKKKKFANVEALDILSKEAELAVERSQSIDEDQLRNLKHQAENSKFSGLKILPIHSHPSSLIETFMNDNSKNEEKEKSSEDDFTSAAHQDSNSSNFGIGNLTPKEKLNATTIYHFGSIPGNSSLSDLDKNMSKSFNLLSDGEESDPEMLSGNEIDLAPVSNNIQHNASERCSKNLRTSNNEELIHDKSNVFEKHDDITDFTRNSDIPNAFSNREFAESARFHNSRYSDFSRHAESSFVSSKPAETNIFDHRNYMNSTGFSSFSSLDNEFPTIDASCLGFVSSNTHFKKPQHENVPVSCSLTTHSYNTEECLNNHKSASLDHVTAIATKSNQEISNNQSINSSRYSHQEMQNQVLDWKNSKNQLRNPFTIPPQIMKNTLLNEAPFKSPLTYPVNPLNQNQVVREEQAESQLKNSTSFISGQEMKNSSSGFNNAKNQSSFSSSEEMLNSESYQSIYSGITMSTSNEVMNDQESAKTYLSDKCAGTNLEKKHSNPDKNPNFNCEKSTKQESGNMVKSHVFPSHKEVLYQEITSDLSKSSNRKMQEPNSVPDQPHGIFSEVQCQFNSVHDKNQTMYFTNSSYQEKNHQEQVELRHSPEASMHQQLVSSVNKTQSNFCTDPSFRQAVESQNSVSSQQRNLVSVQQPQNFVTAAKLEARPSYLSYQENIENQPRFPPVLSSHQLTDVQNHAKDQKICSPILSVQEKIVEGSMTGRSETVYSEVSPQQNIENKESAYSQTSHSPVFISQVVKGQESTESQSRYSPNIPTQQDSENHNLIETSQKNFTLSKCSEIDNQGSSKNQPQLTPNISFGAYIKNPLSNQEPLMNTKRYSPDLSPQGNQSQLHNHNASDAPSQMPNGQYNFGNKLPNGSSCINLSTHTSEVTQSTPPVSNPAIMQTQMQTTFLNSNEPNGNKLTAVKVNVPPSTSELLVVPEKSHRSSGMTFHLFAKPYRNPSQPIASTVVQNGSTEDKNSQELPAVAEDQHAASTMIPAKPDVYELPARQKSPIEQLQILATNPVGTHPSSSCPSLKSISSDNTFKTRNSPEARVSSTSSNVSNGSPSTERLNPVHFKTPDSNGVNAITTGYPNMYQAFVPKSMPLIFNNGSRLPNICGNVTTTTNSVLSPIAQRHSLQSSMLQNGNVQYIYLPASKEIPQENKNLNVKSKNSEKSSQEASSSQVLYSNSNAIQSFPFQTTQINGVPTQYYPPISHYHPKNSVYFFFVKIHSRIFSSFISLISTFQRNFLI